jgi:Flp pilus assembly protein TadB
MMEIFLFLSMMSAGIFLFVLAENLFAILEKIDFVMASGRLLKRILPQKVMSFISSLIRDELRGSHHEKWSEEGIFGLSSFIFLSSLFVTSLLFPVFISLPFSIFLFFSPIIYLRRLKNEYIEEVKREFPLILETVAVCMQAGSDFLTAIKGASSAVKGRWKKDLEEFIKESIWEGKRESALRSFAERVGVEEVKDFAERVIFSMKTGAGISSAIQDIAQEMRRRYFEGIEERAMKLPQKMIFPLLLIFISVFIYILGPVLVGIKMEVIR